MLVSRHEVNKENRQETKLFLLLSHRLGIECHLLSKKDINGKGSVVQDDTEPFMWIYNGKFQTCPLNAQIWQ